MSYGLPQICNEETQNLEFLGCQVGSLPPNEYLPSFKTHCKIGEFDLQITLQWHCTAERRTNPCQDLVNSNRPNNVVINTGV